MDILLIPSYTTVTVYGSVDHIRSHTTHPWGDLPWRTDISTAVGIVTPVPKRLDVGNISPRALSEDVSFGIGTLLVVEQSSMENRTRGGVMV